MKKSRGIEGKTFILILVLMSNRLDIISRQITVNTKSSKIGSLDKIVSNSFQYLKLSDHLSPKQNDIRLEVQQFVDKNVRDKIVQSVQKCQFPSYLLPLLRQSDIPRFLFDKPYGSSCRLTVKGVVLAQLAKGDPGTAIFIGNSIVLAHTIQKIGREEQKNKYLPKIATFQLKGQVQPQIIQDHSLKSHKKRYVNLLNGTTKGLTNTDLLCLLTTDEKDMTQAFLFEPAQINKLKTQKIKSANFVRNLPLSTLTFNDTAVKEYLKIESPSKKLPKIQQIVLTTHLWIAAGMCMGSYQTAVKYSTQRQQFGRSISAFQMNQQKLVKMMASTQTVLLYCFRISKLVEEGKADLGMIYGAHAYVMERSRECCHLGRQICGGNGILSQNYCIRALADLEYLACLEQSPSKASIQSAESLLA